jgi:hypothetical protein
MPAPRRRGAWLRRLLRRLLHPRRRLTRSEQRELDAEKLERARLKGKQFALATEAEIFGAAIPEKLKQLGVCYKYKKSEKDFGDRYKLVALRRPYVLTEEAIYFEVDIRPSGMPHGIGVQHLEDPNVLRNLSQVLGHPVSCKAPGAGGFWYIVEREYGVRGIPGHVDYHQMLLSRSASYSGLYLPVGVGENKRAIWKDLGQMPHMLVAGATLSGKSNALNAFLCTLLRFNSPRRLRLVLVDLKGGMEFARYGGVPHLWTIKHHDGSEEQANIEKRAQVIPWFRRILHEGERRMEVLKAAGAKHIGQYNSKHAREPRQILPHIVVVVDEWADILQDKTISADAAELLMNMASRLRAVGVHLIVCTQVPTAEVVSTRLKTNLPARLALAVPNLHASMAILGDGSAMGLEPQGRAILDWGRKPVPLQMPRVTEDVIDAVVAQAKAGKFDEVQLAEHDVTDQEIFDWAVNENNGDLDYVGLFHKFRFRRVTKEWALAFCQHVEGEQVVVGATTYEVMAPAGRQARRLLPVPESDTPGGAADEQTGPELDPLEPPEPATPEPTPATPGSADVGAAVTHQEIWEWAVRHNGGSLAYKKVWDYFKLRGLSQPLAQSMCRTNPPFPIFVDGVEYVIRPAEQRPGQGRLPRRLEPTDRATAGEWDGGEAGPDEDDDLSGTPDGLDD